MKDLIGWYEYTTEGETIPCYWVSQHIMKDLIVNGMLQYHYKSMPRFTDEEVTKLLLKHKHYEVGSSGIYIIKDYDKDYPYSNLFGNVITHSFESLDAMEKWNLECNPLMIYMQFAHTIQEVENEIQRDRI